MPLVSRSHEIWRELEAAGEQRVLHEVGCLVISRPDDAVERPGFIRRTREAAERLSIAHEILGPDQVRARFPQFCIQPLADIDIMSELTRHLDLVMRDGQIVATSPSLSEP